MRVLCRHGHFQFYPERPAEMADFATIYGTSIVRDGEFYTFPFLKACPRFSIEGQPYKNLPAIKTYEGRNPSEVFRQNELVYSLATFLLVPKLSIVGTAELTKSGGTFVSLSPILQPGLRDASGQQILSYDGLLNLTSRQLLLTEVAYE